MSVDKPLTSIQHLPSPLFIDHIFTCLSPQEIDQASLVCRKWRELTSSPLLWNTLRQTLFPSLSIKDEKTWETHADPSLGLNTKDLKSLDPRALVRKLTLLFRQLKKKEVAIEDNAGLTLLTIPQNLSLNTLRAFAKNPIHGNATDYAFILKLIENELGEKKVTRSYRVLITNSVLENSRHHFTRENEELIKNIDAELPNALAAATLAIITFVSSTSTSPTRLFSGLPETFTRCSEQIKGSRLVIGHHGPDGLYIALHLDCAGLDGVCASWKI